MWETCVCSVSGRSGVVAAAMRDRQGTLSPEICGLCRAFARLAILVSFAGICYTWPRQGRAFCPIRRSHGQANRDDSLALFYDAGYLVMEDALGRNRVATIMRDPKPCSRENTWTLLGAVDDFFPLPRSLGHRGLLLNHYTFDGGIMSSLYRRLQQRSEEFYQCTDDPSDAASLRRQEITVGTLCGLHVAHNSMKWATYQH